MRTAITSAGGGSRAGGTGVAAGILRLLDGRDDDVRAEGGGWEDAFREAPQEAAALSVEAVISTHRLGKDSDALEGLGRGGHDGEARWLLLQKEEILRCAEEEEARWRKEEEVRRREEEATKRYRLQREEATKKRLQGKETERKQRQIEVAKRKHCLLEEAEERYTNK